MNHQLKTWPLYFQLSTATKKTFEVRLNDRNFCVDDEIFLHEYTLEGANEISAHYTGLYFGPLVVTDVIQLPGLLPEYVILLLDNKKAELNVFDPAQKKGVDNYDKTKTLALQIYKTANFDFSTAQNVIKKILKNCKSKAYLEIYTCAALVLTELFLTSDLPKK